MKRHLSSLLLLLTLFGSAATALADGRWRELPPEERQEIRQQMREQWHRKNTEPQRFYNNDKRDLSVDERRRLREEMREQHGRGAHNHDEWRNKNPRRDD